MSADEIRRAAALMRERAEAAEKAHGSPWRPMGSKSVVYPMTKRMSGTVAETYPTGGSAEQVATTIHIASWHPAVALAVANWLASEATHYARNYPKGHLDGELDTASKHALAVARAYLQEASNV